MKQELSVIKAYIETLEEEKSSLMMELSTLITHYYGQDSKEDLSSSLTSPRFDKVMHQFSWGSYLYWNIKGRLYNRGEPFGGKLRSLHVSSEISLYNTRNQRFITKQMCVFIESELSCPDNVLSEIAKKFSVNKNFVIFQNLNARTEETIEDPFVVILPPTRPPGTIVLILQCHYFDPLVNKTRYCLRTNKKLKVLEVKTIIKNELKWKKLELYINGMCVSDDSKIEDFDLNDFSQIMAVQAVSKTVTFTYQPTTDIVTRFSLNIYTSDPVKVVKESFHNRFRKSLMSDGKQGYCVHLKCSEKLLSDENCFGLTSRFHRGDSYQIYLAPFEIVMCNLNYRMGRQRVFGQKTIPINPHCSTAELREEVAKHMHVDPKAVKLQTGSKQRIEEIQKVSDIVSLYNGCKINAEIKKKKTIFVKHPALESPEKIAHLYALEPVSTVRKLIAKKYNLNEFHIVIKCQGTIMKDTLFLYNYPVKNNMVLDFHIFEKRMNITARVTFRRTQMGLLIEDCETITVQDVLNFCAVKLKYRSSASRCVFGEKCLDNRMSLSSCGIKTGCSIIIVYFSEEEQLNGGLQTIFMVDRDGRAVTRYGSIAGGLLLHASKRVKPSVSLVDEELTERLPEGIHETEIPKEPNTRPYQCLNPSQQERLQMATTETNRKNKLIAQKKKFLQKARLLIKRKYSNERPRQSVSERQSPSDNSQTFLKSICSDGSITEHEWNGHSVKGDVTGQDHTQKVNDDEETNVKDLISDVSFSLNDSQNDSQDEIKLIHQELYLEQEGDCSGSGSNPKIHDIDVEHQCYTQNVNYADGDKSNLMRIFENENMEKANELPYQNETSDNNTTKEQGSIKSTADGTLLVKEQADSACPQSINNEPHDLSFSFSGEDTSPKRELLTPNVLQNSFLKSVIDLTSDNGNMSSDSDCRLCIADEEKCMEFRVTYRRRRAESENPVDVSTLVNRLDLENASVNKLIKTAGITIPLLEHVSSETGKHWKQLARRLEVDENYIDNIENNRATLSEACFQALLQWKRQNGLEASKDQLVNALRHIKMNHLAESCENFKTGYNTT